MKNINVSKLTSLLETKINPNNQQPANANTTNKDRNNQPHFRVVNLPNEKINLFEQKDFYHYDKKFHNDLPKVITPPISFHLKSSNENFGSFDNKTMMFGLKNKQEILTDTRLNTNFTKDFMDNALALIFPERQENEVKINKEEILNIIESKDESQVTKEELRSKAYGSSFYLRKSMLISSISNLKKSSSQHLKNLSNRNENNNNDHSVMIENLKKTIESTFENINKIQEGCKHPQKKDVYAKNVYDILPFQEYSGVTFSQILFPDDPLEDISPEEVEKDFKTPNKFILKKKDTEESDLFSLYKVENVKDESEETSTDYVNTAKYFSYERDYLLKFSTNEIETFNRHFLFIDKETKTARLVPLEEKISLKKYKKKVFIDDEENQGYLNKKRERENDLAVYPKNINEDTLVERNNLLTNRGVNKSLNDIRINVNTEELEIAEERVRNRNLMKENKKIYHKKESMDEEEIMANNEEEKKDETDKEDLFNSEKDENESNIFDESDHDKKDEASNDLFDSQGELD